MNGHTGEVLWQCNAKKPLSMASTTKIMTALLLAEQETPEKEIVTTAEMVTVEGSSMGLLCGDTVSYRDLLYGMLLASGNDAANTAAFAIAGGTDRFAEMMNKRAAEIGLVNTHFVTPSGLDSAGHYSTAEDMALLARCALENSCFREACGSEYATLCYGNPPYKRRVKNHNRLLGSYDGLIGVKTGYTQKSGRCLVTAAERGSAYLIAVTLNDPNDWVDHKNLLDYGFSLLSEETLCCEDMQIPIVGADKGYVTVSAEDVIISVADSERQNTGQKIFLPSFVYPDITAGETIGRVEYTVNGRTVAVSPFSAAESVCASSNGGAWFEIICKYKMLLKAMV